MNPEIWGKHAWHFLHVISFDYPINPSQSTRESYYEFFNALSYVLPCGVCRDNYKNKLRTLNLFEHLNSREQLIEFVIKLHNSVSKNLGKIQYSKDKVIDYYSNLYNTNNNINNEPKNNNYINYFIYIFFIFIIIYFIYKKKYV